ncbi:amidase [Zopfochytrium polystomum]|nr:amidase [Zopfochytrium polystomum]
MPPSYTTNRHPTRRVAHLGSGPQLSLAAAVFTAASLSVLSHVPSPPPPSTTATTTTAAYYSSPSAPSPSPRPNVDPDRVNPFPMASCRGLKLEEATIGEMQGWLTGGVVTSVELVRCYLERVAQVDPFVGAIMELNPDALDIAAQMDAERASGSVRGPLHGIPFLVKDNFATDDKVATTAGTVMLLGAKVPRDAHVVALLRAAGAVLLGHSNMSEWADMRSTSYSEGYSARRGQTRNAYNLTQEPGGSSSGSGVAVSANMAAFALGTETDGSIVSPAEREGLVGLKTTLGLTSRAGVIPESSNQDTVGILARTVADAAAVLSVIHGVDPRDAATQAQVGRVPEDGDYTQFVAAAATSTIADKPLAGARFGLPWARVWEAASTRNQLPQLLEAIRRIEDAGATVYNNTDYPSYLTSVSPFGWDWKYPEDNATESSFTYIAVDFYNNVGAYLSELSNTTIRTLADVVAFNYAHTDVEGGYPGTNVAFQSGQDNLLVSLATGGVMDDTYYRALNYSKAAAREQGIDAALRVKGPDGAEIVLDALLVPSDDSAGYPLITIPVGIDAWHVPFGLTLTASAFSEPTLLRLAAAIDAVLGRRRVPPTFYEWNATNIPVNFGVGTY